MRIQTKLCLFILPAFLLVGCNSENNISSTSKDVEIEQSGENTKSILAPKTQSEQRSYALGSTLALRLSHGLEQPAALGIELDEAFVMQGFNDVFTSYSLIPPATSSEILEALQQEMARAAAQSENPNLKDKGENG